MPIDPYWQYATRGGAYAAGGGSRKWKCNFCGYEKIVSVTRVKDHLGRVPRKDVSLCQHVPADVMASLEGWRRQRLGVDTGSDDVEQAGTGHAALEASSSRVAPSKRSRVEPAADSVLASSSVPRSAPYIAVQEKKLLLKLAQSPNFKMEGANVERDAEVWLEAMDDYFEVAGTHPQNQTMLAMFKLIRDAKIWWKMHIRDSDIIGTSQSWEEIKDAVTARYLPPAHKTTKMNDFFSLCQLSFTLEEYYFKFVTLQRYEPKMTLEQQVARFCQGLIEPLNNRLENFRLANLQDPLLRAKTLAVEIQKAQQATTAAIELPNVRCYECQEYGHYRNRCLRITRASEANAVPVNATARGQPNNCEGQGRVNRGQGRGAVSRTNAAIGQPTVGYEANERVVLHTAIDYSGARQQFAISKLPELIKVIKLNFS
ncbi:hypothetical protein L7F22_006942 [Adiantum nelumboides]|nr:hypothetical protein [Adiantum nelumboides]